MTTRTAPGGGPTGTAPSPAMVIRAAVPDRGVRIDLEVPAGQVVALLGANGAGKSTAVSLAAGTLRPSSGEVWVAGRQVAGAGHWVPPHRRRISLLAQEPLLLPHLDVLENVAFGPRALGAGRGPARQTALARLEEVGAAHLADRRPRELSGGQQQRVALARALAPDPQLLLLDEPLAALDVDAAAELRQVLRSSLRETGRTAVVVTHDLLDVLALADAVVVLEEGRVVEHGGTMEVLRRPRSTFAARFAGVNLLTGTRVGSDAVQADDVVLHGLAGDGEDGSAAVRTPELSAGAGQSRAVGAGRDVPAGAGQSRAVGPERDVPAGAGQDPAVGRGAAATFSPRAVAVYREPPSGSPRNAVAVQVVGIEQQGELVRVRGRTDSGTRLAADITAPSVASLALAVGQRVTFVIKAAEVTIYAA